MIRVRVFRVIYGLGFMQLGYGLGYIYDLINNIYSDKFL
jgi:hypothetical protein